MLRTVGAAANSTRASSASGWYARVPFALAPQGEDGRSNPAGGGDVRNAVVEGGPDVRAPLRMPPSRSLGNSVSFAVTAGVPGQGSVDGYMGLNSSHTAN